MGSQRQDHFLNLERMRNREVNVHTTYTSRSHSRSGSHVSHGEDTRNLQLKVDHLRRKLRRKQRKGIPSSSGSQSDDDDSYRPRSRTPPSESFSYNEECHHRRRSSSPAYRGLRNDTMSKVLHQISKSPFTRRIERAKLPQRFAQPTFTMYNGRTDPVEHVSHFNHKMVVHSRNETLMCKVFPSSLGSIAMRWFDGLEEGFLVPFRARFATCSRVPRPLDSLLSMVMREGETLKIYSDRYCEMFNEIDGDFKDVAIRTFKVGLPI